MSDPEKAFDPSALEATFRAMLAWQQTEDGKRHAEIFRAQSARQALRELEDTAAARGVILDPGVRKVALQRDAAGPLLDAVRAAIAYHRPVGRRTRRPAVLYLGSGPGVGKTSALCWAVTHAPRSARYVKSSTIDVTKRAGWSTDEEQWKRWESVELLALDEAGLEKEPECITKLLLERWDHASLTVIAGNLTAKEFSGRYCTGPAGERLVDRFRDQASKGLRVVRMFMSEQSRRAR